MGIAKVLFQRLSGPGAAEVKGDGLHRLQVSPSVAFVMFEV